MKTVGFTLLVGLAGYVLGVMLGFVVVNLFSTNQHDKAIEAAMTSFFVFGPGLAILSVIVFLVIRFAR
jgi:F0F1-type ATP synthase membrane subunit c/vacuolar-type H+-ATPase subunit K